MADKLTEAAGRSLDAVTAPKTGPEQLAPANADTRRIILVGCACWLVALLATLAVPTLHSGNRGWWPWACITGLVLGGLGLLSVRRRS